MKIDCGINCFSPELNGALEVNHHGVCLFSDCTDDVFRNTVLILSIWRAWLICCASSREDISEGSIAVFSSSIIPPESLDLVSHGVNLGLK
jgi:hypothetical protein